MQKKPEAIWAIKDPEGDILYWTLSNGEDSAWLRGNYRYEVSREKAAAAGFSVVKVEVKELV